MATQATSHLENIDRRSTTQAGFRKHKDTIHQLQNVVMALEDAKLYRKNIYALIVDFTSAFNTTDHDRVLWIMYDLGFPADAVGAVRNLYEHACHHQGNLPSGVCTIKIPIERGTIQGDTLSPFSLPTLYGAPPVPVVEGRFSLSTVSVQCVPF